MTKSTSQGGRPRWPGVEAAVLGAAIDLVTAKGYTHTTIDAIARHAGVAKTTIYRRWRHKEELASDALVLAMGEPPTTDFPGEAAVRDSIGWLAARIREAPVQALLIGLLAEAAHDPGTRERLRTRFRDPFVARLIADWHLPSTHVDVAFDIVVGGLLHRLAATGVIDAQDMTAFVSAATNLLFPVNHRGNRAVQASDQEP